MSLSERIEQDYIIAYKGKDELKVSVLRLLKSAAKNRLVELKRTQGALTDSEYQDVIIRQAKQRQDSIEQYLQAGRKDLADREQAELEALAAYLPKRLSMEELAKAVDEAVREAGASSPRDMGKVMKIMMERHKGAVDGKLLSETVKARLAQA